ncbi:MAG: hypothetical protein JWO96_769 [Candidatus Saccharibacteria bacterium]|nr:hypothetical protein [Candidatus Saccharibacteria bacterium]
MENKQDFSKVMDVSPPRPSQTSRPIIVGHRPMMSDPMMTRPPIPQAPVNAAPAQVESHQAKTIPVSHNGQTAPTVQVPPTPAAPPPPSVQTPAEIPAAPQTALAAEFEPAAMPPADVVNAALSPAPAPAGPLHLQSLPVSHAPVTGQGRLRVLMGWLFILLALGAVGAYLAIDAGLIGSSINLPFHIFG